MIMHYLILIVMSLFAGITVKYADYLEDTKKSSKKSRIIAGSIYGAVLFLTLYLYPVIAPLWVGTVAGLLFYGKIDGTAHYYGVGVFAGLTLISTLTYKGFLISPILLTIVIIANILEEKFHDMYDKKKKSILKTILEYRPILKVVALGMSIWMNAWEIFVALMMHDVGYYLTYMKFEK